MENQNIDSFKCKLSNKLTWEATESEEERPHSLIPSKKKELHFLLLIWFTAIRQERLKEESNAAPKQFCSKWLQRLVFSLPQRKKKEKKKRHHSDVPGLYLFLVANIQRAVVLPITFTRYWRTSSWLWWAIKSSVFVPSSPSHLCASKGLEPITLEAIRLNKWSVCRPCHGYLRATWGLFVSTMMAPLKPHTDTGRSGSSPKSIKRLQGSDHTQDELNVM